jgi:hypothetical protein
MPMESANSLTVAGPWRSLRMIRKRLSSPSAFMAAMQSNAFTIKTLARIQVVQIAAFFWGSCKRN